MTTYSKISKNMLDQEKGTKAYGTGEHDWDEAFGYYGAARNGNEFSIDDEAVGKTPGEGFPESRDAYKNGYNDANEDGGIILDQKSFPVYLKIVRSETVWISTLTV